MKTITVRLPERLAADIESESRTRKISKSDVVRQRLEAGQSKSSSGLLEAVTRVIGCVDGLPPDLSTRKKWYLKKTGYGKKRAR